MSVYILIKNFYRFYEPASYFVQFYRLKLTDNRHLITSGRDSLRLNNYTAGAWTHSLPSASLHDSAEGSDHLTLSPPHKPNVVEVV